MGVGCVLGQAGVKRSEGVSYFRFRHSHGGLRKAFYACLEAAGIRRIRFHDLRHTFASLLIQQGANPKYIQQQLGHGSISITLDIYSHLFHGDHRHHVHQLDDPQERTEKTRGDNPESVTQAQPLESDDGGVLTELVDSKNE